MAKSKKVKLDVNEAVTVEIALCEWFYHSLKKKVTDEFAADAIRYHAERTLAVVDKIGTAFHQKPDRSEMTEDFEKWLKKNAKWFED